MLLLPAVELFGIQDGELVIAIAVAIPYSSGMLLLLFEEEEIDLDPYGQNMVAIPYSSGMLLLPGRGPIIARHHRRRNPLFIGNAFATVPHQT